MACDHRRERERKGSGNVMDKALESNGEREIWKLRFEHEEKERSTASLAQTSEGGMESSVISPWNRPDIAGEKKGHFQRAVRREGELV